MTGTARIVLILLAVVALAVLIAVVGFDVGKEDKQASTQTTTVSQRSAEVLKKQAQQRAGSAGAGVEDGPGSASDDSTGAPGAVGLDLNDTGNQVTLARPFAATSPWNTPSIGLPTDEHSARFMKLADERPGLAETGNGTPKRIVVRGRRGLFINTSRWSVPIYTTQNGVETRLVCRQAILYCGQGSKVPSLPIPANASPKPQYDGQFVVQDLDNGIAYTMFRARRGAGNVISYQFMRAWTLNGPGYQVPNSVSTIGSGLPSFAGVLLPQEVRAGRIEHALAIALPGPARDTYVQPASATDGVGSPDSIPEGARIRLKANVKAPKLAGRTNIVAQRALMKALRTYGAIVVERSKSPTLYAKMNYDWSQPMRGANGRLLAADGKLLPRRDNLRRNATPLLRGNEIQGLKLSDFEVVQITGKTYTFPALNTTEAANRPSSSGSNN